MNNADEIEQAKFVLLSLIGKLYVLSKQSIGEKQKEYGEQIKLFTKCLVCQSGKFAIRKTKIQLVTIF